MSAVMNCATTYKDRFERKHGVKLGLHWVFCALLRAGAHGNHPVNGEIDGADNRYKKTTTTLGWLRSAPTKVWWWHDGARCEEIARADREGRCRFRAARDAGLAQIRGDAGRPRFTISNGGGLWLVISRTAFSMRRSQAYSECHKSRGQRPMYAPARSRSPDDVSGLVITTPPRDGAEAVTFLVRVCERVGGTRPQLWWICETFAAITPKLDQEKERVSIMYYEPNHVICYGPAGDGCATAQRSSAMKVAVVEKDDTFAALPQHRLHSSKAMLHASEL